MHLSDTRNIDNENADEETMAAAGPAADSGNGHFGTGPSTEVRGWLPNRGYSGYSERELIAAEERAFEIGFASAFERERVEAERRTLCSVRPDQRRAR